MTASSRPTSEEHLAHIGAVPEISSQQTLEIHVQAAQIPSDSRVIATSDAAKPLQHFSRAPGRGVPTDVSLPAVGTGEPDTSMHLSNLSLNEDGSAVAFASIIGRDGTASPSKKRPATSEAHGPRPSSVLRSSHVKAAQGSGNLNPSSQPLIQGGIPCPENHNGKLFAPNETAMSSGNFEQPASLLQNTLNVQSDEDHEMRDSLQETSFQSPELRHAAIDPGLVQIESNMQKGLRDSISDSPPQEAVKQIAANHMNSEQLVAEIRALYRSLEIVEKRCISLDQTHMADKERLSAPTMEHWQVLTALHRTLLYEHHDFLLATQQLTAPKEVRRLAAERHIPFRMWKYAIHAFLELLRQNLPDTLEFMESFIYLAYQMIALHYETIPSFQDVWMECLGDLARYRMAIESQSAGVRDVWTQVAQYWYSKASDSQPSVGRLYHHLGILARPNLPRQLFYYCKALCCTTPFPNANLSIKAVFDARSQPQVYPPSDSFRAIDQAFLRVHEAFYEAKYPDEAIEARDVLLEHLQSSLESRKMKTLERQWKHYGVLLAVANMAACFHYGDHEDTLRKALIGQPHKEIQTGRFWKQLSFSLLSSTLSVFLSCEMQVCVLPLVHVIFVLLHCISSLRGRCLEALVLLQSMPWNAVVDFLNGIGKCRDFMAGILKSKPDASETFLPFDKNDGEPLMEDRAMRGLVWTQNYFPEHWFDGRELDELPHQELASSETVRAQRVIWLGVEIAQTSGFMHFNPSDGTFTLATSASLLSA